MTLAVSRNPYERFTNPSVRNKIVGSVQHRFARSVGSDEIEDAYGHMLEQLSKMPVADVEAIVNEEVWLFVGMRNRLSDRLRLRSASDVHFADLEDADVLDVLGDAEDVVTGSVIGREAAAERLAEVAELVWLKFTGADGQIAARILLEDAKPSAVAAELGLDPAHVSVVAHKAHQERRLLERKLKENPEFRCWRLRKHMTTYYSTGEISLALRAHWITCPKCRAAERVVRERTYAALAPLLPGAAITAGGGGALARVLRHATRPARRLLRPGGQVGAKAGASSTQAVSFGATVTTKAAVIATAAVLGTTAAGAGALVVVRHFSRQHPRSTTTRTIAPLVVTPPTSPAPSRAAATSTSLTKARPSSTSTRPSKRRKHRARAKRVRRQPTATVATATTKTQTPPTTSPQTTSSSAPTTSRSPTTSTTAGQLSNPSYATPSQP